VTAASEWDHPAERKQVRPSLPGSIERLFHNTGTPQFVLNLKEGGVSVAGLNTDRLERAIGVIYRPDTERASHYFHVRLAEQFDAVIHIDHTRAVEPLERTSQWQDREPAETYPSGL
jgi:erythromycin esterase-like protein